jgi:hypothetical protein
MRRKQHENPQRFIFLTAPAPVPILDRLFGGSCVPAICEHCADGGADKYCFRGNPERTRRCSRNYFRPGSLRNASVISTTSLLIIVSTALLVLYIFDFGS